MSVPRGRGRRDNKRQPNARARRTNPKWRPAFLEALKRAPNVVTACEVAGVPRCTAYNARRDDPDFAKAWAEAWEVGMYAIDAEMYRRAVDGWLEPVYQQGAQVGTVRKYSDAMLALFSKAHAEKYRATTQVQLTGKGGGAVEVTLDVRTRAFERLKHSIATDPRFASLRPAGTNGTHQPAPA